MKLKCAKVHSFSAAVAALDGDGKDQAQGERFRVVAVHRHAAVLLHGDSDGVHNDQKLELHDIRAPGGEAASSVLATTKLSKGMAFPPRILSGSFGVVWRDGGANNSLCVLDLCSGEVNAVELFPPEPIADAFVNSTGEQIVVVGKTSGRLWEWRQNSRATATQASAEWRLIDVAASLEEQVVGVYSGRFFSSAVLGVCFELLRVLQRSDGVVVAEKWLFDVETRWMQISYSSRALGKQSTPSLTMQLYLSEEWRHAVVAIWDTLYCFPADHDLGDGTVQQVSLKERVRSATWIDKQDILLLLLSDGQLRMAHVDPHKRFAVMQIETPDMVSECPSGSIWTEDVDTSDFQLAWIPDAKRLVVVLGGNCAVFTAELVDDTASDILDGDSRGATLLTAIMDHLFSSRNSPEVITSLKADETRDIGDCIRKRLESTAPPSAGELLDISRFALVRSCNVFEDLYFTLLCIIHRQLADEPISSEESAQESTASALKEMKLMEVLLSLTISIGAPELRRVASRILAGSSSCSSKSERREYYQAEMDTISRCVKSRLTNDDSSEAWWVESREVGAFTQVYLPRISTLLHKLTTCSSRDGKNAVEALGRPVALCQAIMDKNWEAVCLQTEEATTRVLKMKASDDDQDIAADKLVLLIASYTMTCSNLHVAGVVINLEHLLSAILPAVDPVGRKLLCCFLQPWNGEFGDGNDTSGPNSAPHSWSLESAVKIAEIAGALQLLVDFSIASGSQCTHACMRTVCTSLEAIRKSLPIEALGARQEPYDAHLHACEAYIGEILAIVQQLRVVPEFLHCPHQAQVKAARPSRTFPAKCRFDMFCERIWVEITGNEGNNGGSGRDDLLWKFSGQEDRLRNRILRLVGRIAWHIKCTTRDVPRLYKRAFVADWLAGHVEGMALDKTICEFVAKAQSIHASESTVQQPLSHFQDQDLPGSNTALEDEIFSFRWRKVVRSMMLTVWALWLREKAACCLRCISLAKREALDTTDINLETVGALAATCSLQLNSLSLMCGRGDHFSIQLSLLEGSARLNPEKTAAVIGWGFPADKIPTRQLKRYKMLRREVKEQLASTRPPLEALEQQSQLLQKHGRRKARELLRTGATNHREEGTAKRILEPKRDTNSDIGVLLDCCFIPEFQRLVATVAGTNPMSKPTCSATIFTQRDCKIRAGLKCHSSISQKFVSRDEVLAMLQDQTQQLEEKIRVLTATSVVSESNLEQGSEVQPAKRIHLPGRNVPARSASNSPGLEHITIRDLDFRRHLTDSTEGKIEMKPRKGRPQKQFPRHHDSVHNALKLFHLRRQTSGHEPQQDGLRPQAFRSRSLPRSNNVVVDAETQCQDEAPDKLTEICAGSNEHQPPPPVTSKKELEMSRKMCKGQELPSVYPLRFEYGLDGASLKLLGRRDPGRPNPPVRARQFVYRESQRPPSKREKKSKPNTGCFTAASPEIVALKTSSAQTSRSRDENAVVPEVTPSTGELTGGADVKLGLEGNFGIPQKPEAQNQRSSEPPAVLSEVDDKHPPSRGVAIQCRVEEGIRSKTGRRKRGPPLLDIPDRFPIWVDLDGAVDRAKGKERKRFLQVVRFADTNTTQTSTRATDDEFIIDAHSIELVSMQTAASSSLSHSECASEESQYADSRAEATPQLQPVDYELTAEENKKAMQAKYQASYRQHFPISEPSNTREMDDPTRGIESLIELQEDMKRMTERLRALEKCADTIDEEFQASHKRLKSMEDTRHASVTSKARVLEGIDEILEVTAFDVASEPGQQPHNKKPRPSLLAKKASSDMAAAKKLLETIEQLTLEDEEKT